MKKKIFFTGSTGILGCNWIDNLSKKYELLTSSYSNQAFYKKSENVILSDSSIKKLVYKVTNYNPDIIIHTAALTNVDKCQKNKTQAIHANFHFTKELVKVAKKSNTRFIFISSDHVFDGNKEEYSENEKPSPINIYGLTKTLSEEYIIKNLEKYLIIRTNFFGLGNYYKQSLAEKIINNLNLNLPIKLFDNIYFNPVDINVLIKSVNLLINKNKIGIFNIASNKKISKYDFGILLAKKFKLNHKMIIRTQYSKKIKITKRPLNMYISNKKITRIINDKSFDINYNIKTFKYDYENNYNKFRSIIPYGRHHLFKKDILSVVNILKNKNLTQGDEVQKFENNIARYVGCKYAIAVSSASTGLLISFKAIRLNKKTKLYTSPITFVSSSNAALHSNSKVVFLDIKKNTLNIDYKLIKNKNSLNQDIIMPIHFAGAPCDMMQINKIAKANNYKIIEDAAHGLGGRYLDGSKIGNCKYSDITVFSFHPVKSITSGEGGVITTNNYFLYKKILRLRSHGINKLDDEMLNQNHSTTNGIKNPWYYEMTANGYNSRLTDFQSALANSQLSSLDDFINKRRKLAKRYDIKLKKIPNIDPIQKKFRKYSSHHLYVVKINFNKLKTNRALLMNQLKQDGILTQVHYIPVPMHPYYEKLGFNMKKLSNSQEYYDGALTLPLYYELTYDMQDFVIKKIKEYLN